MISMTFAAKKVAAFAALIVLFGWCGLVEAPRIEAGLEARVTEEMSRFAWAQVEVNGRQVSVSGAPTQGDWALVRRRLQGVAGVGRVVNGDQSFKEAEQ